MMDVLKINLVEPRYTGLKTEEWGFELISRWTAIQVEISPKDGIRTGC